VQIQTFCRAFHPLYLSKAKEGCFQARLKDPLKNGKPLGCVSSRFFPREFPGLLGNFVSREGISNDDKNKKNKE
jgi:hypothetical protein